VAGGREEVPGGDGGDVGSFGPGVEGTKEVPGGDGGDVGTSGRRVEATKEVPAVAFGLKPVCGDWIAWDWLSASVTVGSEAGGRSAAAASAAFCFLWFRCLLRCWVALSLPTPAETLGAAGVEKAPVEASALSVGVAASFLTGFRPASA